MTAEEALLHLLVAAARQARRSGRASAHTQHFLFSLCHVEEHLGLRSHMVLVPQ